MMGFKLDRLDDLELAQDLLLGVRSKDGEPNVSSPKLIPVSPCKGEPSTEVRRGGDTPTNLTDFNGDSLTHGALSL